MVAMPLISPLMPVPESNSQNMVPFDLSYGFLLVCYCNFAHNTIFGDIQLVSIQ